MAEFKTQKQQRAQATRAQREGVEMGRDPKAQAAWMSYMKQLSQQTTSETENVDLLSDLTPSQRSYIENLQAIEALNPKASPEDIAMAISLLLWEGRIWERDGSAADVTQPAGIPLVLDYAGGDGYRSVKMDPKQEQILREQRGVRDQQGTPSGVSHTFPAVAAWAGREESMTGGYNAHMVTSGGDFIQDMARLIVEQDLNIFREAERRDNERAQALAQENKGSGRSLSSCLLEHFREENEAEKGVDLDPPLSDNAFNAP